jgi:choline dehydrogenase-like flavoprotein
MPLNRLIDSGVPFQPDVQQTTLGLDVLSRYVTSTWDEAVQNGGPPFHAIVIGAGMFGAYCGEQIFRQGANNGLRVLVLDAGPFVVASHLQNLPRIGLFEPQPLSPAADPGVARALVWGMPWRSNVDWVGQAYCVGGKSLYWGGWCPRLLASDLAGWPPTVAAYLNANYGTLERQTGVDVRTDFIQGPLFDLLMARTTALIGGAVPNTDTVEEPPLAVQGDPPAAGLFSFDKFSSITLLVDAVREAANQPDSQRRLFVVPNAHVTRLQASNGMVTGVQASVNGVTRFLSVAPGVSVILALGTIESTRLALASFPRSTNPAQELMGRNLMGHVRIDTYARIRRTALDPAATLPNALQTAALLVRGSTPQGRFHIQVTASADPGLNSDALLFTMIPDIDQLDKILASQQNGWISFALRGSSQMDGDVGSAVPNGSGRWINLSPFESDEFGIPRAYVQMTTTSAEKTLATAMENAMATLLRQLAGGNPADLQITSTTRNGLGTTYHEAGTLWMGTNPATSVTDTNGRFHHVQNAYCADQSLFVTVGSVNPTLTGLTLARKVAQAVVARATGAPAPP